MKRLLVALLLFGLVLAVSSPASAGGSWLYPVQDRLDPGDTATFVGYVGPGQLGWVEDGPFYAYLRINPQPVDYAAEFPFIQESDLPLGELEITERGDLGYLSLRVAITFTVPADLDPDEYALVYCNDPCAEGLGDLIGAFVYVGFDNQFGADCRPWAFDEPEIANLDPGTFVCGVDGDATAAEILAGDATMTEYGEVITGSGTTVPTGAVTESELELTREAAIQELRDRLQQEVLANPQAAALIRSQTDFLIAQGDVRVVRTEDGPWLSPVVLAAVVIGVTAAGIVAITALRRRRDRQTGVSP